MGDPHPLRRGLPIRDFMLTESTASFIRDVRLICETIFDIMLSGYISTLTAFRNQSEDKCRKESKPRRGTLPWELWDEAIKCANDALEKCREGEVYRRADTIDRADALTTEAIEALKHRYTF
jgi:hypothetical protein